MKENLILKNSNLKISKVVTGLLSNNVYLVESDGEKCIIDPSCNADILIDVFGKDINKMIITHYHFDHIGAAKDIKELTKCKVYASYIDSPIISQKKPIPVNHRHINPVNVDVELRESDKVNIGNTCWEVIETPGHTPGSICLYYNDTSSKNVLFAGDTLFYESCGRTDFSDGNAQDMIISLCKLSTLDNNTIVLPGHGTETSIEHEKHFTLQI